MAIMRSQLKNERGNFFFSPPGFETWSPLSYTDSSGNFGGGWLGGGFKVVSRPVFYRSQICHVIVYQNAVKI